ncbi:hypothetical protein [Ramlibacter sp.]|uniref:hypothetical protein n=1 Tax=Ramlibacter sp. TaxID=1917967 RepID=UPI003D104939
MDQNNRLFATVVALFSFVAFAGPPALAATPPCSAANFSVARFDAIQRGMSVDQVVAVIGCGPTDLGSQSTRQWRLLTWSVGAPGTPALSISVWFDTSNWQAQPLVGPSFKIAQGF